jgi:hypothetical protein
VIVDAASLHRWQRELMRRAALAAGASFTIVGVRASESVLRERVRARQAASLDASEADELVLEHQMRTQDPLSRDELLGSITVEGGAATSGSGWEACVRDLAARRRPRACTVKLDLDQPAGSASG